MEQRLTTHPFDYSSLLARWGKERADAKALAERLVSEVKTLAVPVCRGFGATRVVLFGSLVAGRAREASDVDLVVLGTAPGDFWRLRAALEEALHRNVDLHTEADDAAFVDKMMRRGLLLDER